MNNAKSNTDKTILVFSEARPLLELDLSFRMYTKPIIRLYIIRIRRVIIANLNIETYYH